MLRLIPYLLCLSFGVHLGSSYSVLGNAWSTLTVTGLCISAMVYANYAFKGGHKVGYTQGFAAGVKSTIELRNAIQELWQTAVNLIHCMSSQLGLNEKAICSEEMNAKAEEMTAITIKQTSHQLQSIVSNLNHLSVKKTFEQVGKQVGSMLGFQVS